MRRLLALLLCVVMLLCSLTSCLPILMGEIVGEAVGGDTVNLSQLTDSVMNAQSASVRINSRFISPSGVVSTQGSGVIFKEGNVSFFLLTNHHVLVDDLGNTAPSYKILDAYGNQHTAYIYALSEEYDLGILKFDKASADASLTAVPLATANPENGDIVFSIGTPEGLINAVTYGKQLDCSDIDLDELDIAVTAHSCFVDHGSSGGGLFDADGNLVGVNYAYGESEDGSSRYSFAIPIESVIGFLRANNLDPEEF